MKNLYNLLMKQYKLDTGQLGGMYAVILQTLGIVGLLTFINTFISAYQTFWRYHISFPLLLITVFFLGSFALWFVHAILYPSFVQFSNRQSYSLNDSPIKKDIEEIKETLELIQKSLKKEEP